MPEPSIPTPIPTRDDLDAILRTRAGALEETPYPILLLALAIRQESGVLKLRSKYMEKNVVFDDGSPVECHSNIATETLGRFLVASGKLSEKDCHAALSQAASRGVPLGEILTERNLLAPAELERTLQQNLGRKLLEPFRWKSGNWQILYDVPRPTSTLRVKVPQLLVTGIMKVETHEAAEEAVDFARRKYLAIAPDPLFGLEELRLSADQQKIVDAARRGTMLDEIRLATTIDPEDIDRMVYALLLLGVITATDKPVRRPARTELAPPVAAAATLPPPAPAFPPPPAAEPPESRMLPPATTDEITSTYLVYRRQDAFDLLGVAETEEMGAIAKAFLQMAERFLPSRFDPQDPDAIRDKAEQVFLAAAKAYAELADQDRREALIQRRLKARELAAAAAQFGTAAVIDPEVLWKTGRDLVAAGKLREALSNFEMAADCDAQNGTYAAEAIWCRYQLRITPPASALKMLRNALRIDPNCAVAHLYVGKLHAVLGNQLEADAYLNRAATLMPGGRHVVGTPKASKPPFGQR